MKNYEHALSMRCLYLKNSVKGSSSTALLFRASPNFNF